MTANAVAPYPPAPSFPVLKDFFYTFSKGEKIGIFGGNGSGKSTLLNIITGNLPPDSGEVIKGENTFFGYYQQNPVFKDLNMTVLDYIKEAADVVQMNDGRTLSASLFLKQFGFEGKIQHSMLSTLSGGERKRVFLVRLLISNPNFLILDEPTNDFDIFTMNILEEFLLGYKGCLLIVSHDRYFMDKIADTMFIMEEDGAVSGFVGKCSEYLDYLEETENRKLKAESGKRKAESLGKVSVETNGLTNGSSVSQTKNPLGEVSHSQQSVAKSSTTSSVGGSTPATPPKPRRKTFKEQKEFENLEAEIMELEEKKSELEQLMTSSDYAVVQKAGEEYKSVEEKLTADYARWEELAELS